MAAERKGFCMFLYGFVMCFAWFYDVVCGFYVVLYRVLEVVLWS